MALESWTVIFDNQQAGAGTAGYTFKNQTEASGQGPMEICKLITVQAGSEAEAAKAVKLAFGHGVITGGFKLAKSSNIKEINP